MLQDFPDQRIVNMSDDHILEREFPTNQIQQIGTITDLLSIQEKDSKFFNHLNLNKESTEEINQDILKSEKPSKQKKKRIRKYTSNNPNNKKGHWTVQENLKYHYFLESNAQFFIDSQRRKTDKIFKSMSAFIETREAHQCRSHHQKIEKKWDSFPKILLNLRLQNFNHTKRKYLIKGFQKMGMQDLNFFEDDELKNQEQLYRKIVEAKKCMEECQVENRPEENNSIGQTLANCHKPNCMCLMMSERYEDQLNF